jgi:LacI family repressor for deo operon, udp, cdd, tsx, nupC, and nupG
MPDLMAPDKKLGRSRPTNIREVAKLANTSVATVSRALQNPDVVAPETLNRVLAAVADLDYTPSAQPNILRTARTNVIVALVSDIGNPFFAEVVQGIEQVAFEEGYSVLLGDTQLNSSREQAYARLIATRQADGLITALPHLPSGIGATRIPLVNVGEYIENPNVTSVFVDNIAAAQAAVTYLITIGHRDIAFLSGPLNTPVCAEREAGYERALAEAEIMRDRGLTAVGDFSFESGSKGIHALIDRGCKFSAIFCSNDEMAIGAIQSIKACGLRVPEDISVVGFDDIRFARFTDPPLTTIAQPKNRLGREAMNLLVQILRSGDGPPTNCVLPSELIIRASTCARH